MPFENTLKALDRAGYSVPVDPCHTFETDEYFPEMIAQQSKYYCANFEQFKAENIGILVSGGSGTGKTYLSECIANELMKIGIDVLAISPVVFSKLPPNRQNAIEDTPYDALLKAVSKIPLLILDDLGAGSRSNYANAQTLFIIDRRLRAKLPLIVTTNIEPKRIQEYAGFTGEPLSGVDDPIMYNRIYSRVMEACPKRFILNKKCVRQTIADERRDKANAMFAQAERHDQGE